MPLPVMAAAAALALLRPGLGLPRPQVRETNATPAEAPAQSLAPQRWDIIGPFPYSSREQGADVLEAFGGILGIPRAGPETYPSELVSAWAGRQAGRAGWSTVSTEPDGQTVHIDFGDLRLDFIAEEFGGSAYYTRGWAVGTFEVPQAGMYSVECSGVGSFLLDRTDKLYGDAYRTGWRAVHAVPLAEGAHTLHVPFVTWGATKSFSCAITADGPDAASAPLQPVLRGGLGGRPMLFGDIVDGVLASDLGSVVVENRGSLPLTGLSAEVTSTSDFRVALSERSSVRLAPRQQLPLRLSVTQLAPSVACTDFGDWRGRQYPLTIALRASVAHEYHAASAPAFNVAVAVNLTCQAYGEAYKFTFADADESVQYAAARPPAGPCPARGCPVLFATHGAGVEADPRRNPAWAYAYQRQDAAWILLPTNRDAYGYDWQMVGFENGLRALRHLAAELPGVPAALRPVTGADTDRLLYSGHSMGGHGCLEYLTHYGDRALAGAPAAGWISMELYSFGQLRTGDGLVDPTLRGILYSALSEWDADLYAANAVGIPMLARVGGNDTSVPPWHLRRFARLVDQEAATPGLVRISEVPGEGHWWGGVVGDAEMQQFYGEALSAGLPPLPRRFVSVTMNPASSDGRGGVRIEQLRIPYRMARISVDRGAQPGVPWQLETENVRRFSLYELPGRPLPTSGIVVDGVAFGWRALPVAPAHFCFLEGPRGRAATWRVCEGQDATSWLVVERSRANYGPMRQVFHTAPLVLVYGTGSSTSSYNDLMESRARYLANAAYYKGRFAITILPDSHPMTRDLLTGVGGYNVLILGGPDVNRFAAASRQYWPIICEGGGAYGPTVYRVGSRSYNAAGLGLAFLAPLWPVGATSPAEAGPPRLALVVAGSTQEGFDLATTLVPLSSGLTVPDYIVAEPSFKWRGAGGVVAAGYYDNTWGVSEASGYLRPFSGRGGIAL